MKKTPSRLLYGRAFQDFRRLLFRVGDDDAGIGSVDFHRVARQESARKQFFGERRFHRLLHVPLQRSCAENRIVAVFRKVCARFVGNFQSQPLFRESFSERRNEKFYDLFDFAFLQRFENDDFVQTV